jgi:hypothetical protein
VRIDWAIPSRFAEAGQDGTATLIGAGVDSLWVSDVPADVGVMLMVRLAAPPDEFDEQHELEVRLVKPDSEEREILKVKFGPIPKSALFQPGFEQGLFVPTAIGWHVEERGLYTLELYLDSRRQRSIPILIRDPADIPPPGGQPPGQA